MPHLRGPGQTFEMYVIYFAHIILFLSPQFFLQEI